MKQQQVQRPKFRLVAQFIAALAMSQALANTDNSETKSGFRYAGLGAFNGAPVYTPRKGKFKGYMRDKQYKAKHG